MRWRASLSILRVDFSSVGKRIEFELFGWFLHSDGRAGSLEVRTGRVLGKCDA